MGKSEGIPCTNPFINVLSKLTYPAISYEVLNLANFFLIVSAHMVNHKQFVFTQEDQNYSFSFTSRIY